MELKLQSILFPDKEEYTDNADLFYKGGLVHVILGHI